MKKWILGSLLSVSVILNAQESDAAPAKDASAPWFTGSLIAPEGTVVPYGKFLIKSCLSFTREARSNVWLNLPGTTSFYSLKPEFQCYFGLTPWCDINITPRFQFNSCYGERHFDLGDLTAGLDFQLLPADFSLYFPGIKLAIRKVLPTGSYEMLHPRKMYTDQTGMGTYSTQFDLVFYKMLHLNNLHWLTTTFSTQYSINTPLLVRGYNAYGGATGTKLTVNPGSNFRNILSFEYSLNRNWALALDNIYSYSQETTSEGRFKGIAYNHKRAITGKPVSEQISFAPAVEYNFSQNFGMIAGFWFSAWGRNSTEFQSGIMNFAYRF